MKIVSKKPGYGKNVYKVELTEDERKMTDNDIVTIADNNGKYGQQVCHFGGVVKDKLSEVTTIEVWID